VNGAEQGSRHDIGNTHRARLDAALHVAAKGNDCGRRLCPARGRDDLERLLTTAASRLPTPGDATALARGLLQ
jgi:hypothetical protein